MRYRPWHLHGIAAGGLALPEDRAAIAAEHFEMFSEQYTRLGQTRGDVCRAAIMLDNRAITSMAKDILRETKG